MYIYVQHVILYGKLKRKNNIYIIFEYIIMNYIDSILILFLAIASAFPVIIVRYFIEEKIYDIFTIIKIIIQLIFLYTFLNLGYIYLIFHKIPMAQFYPIIKLIELIIPIIYSIVFFKDKLIPINYVGIVLAIIAIICIEQK